MPSVHTLQTESWGNCHTNESDLREESETKILSRRCTTEAAEKYF